MNIMTESVLAILKLLENNPLTAAEVSRKTGIEHTLVDKAMNGLEEEGVIMFESKVKRRLT